MKIKFIPLIYLCALLAFFALQVVSYSARAQLNLTAKQLRVDSIKARVDTLNLINTSYSILCVNDTAFSGYVQNLAGTGIPYDSTRRMHLVIIDSTGTLTTLPDVRKNYANGGLVLMSGFYNNEISPSGSGLSIFGMPELLLGSYSNMNFTGGNNGEFYFVLGGSSPGEQTRDVVTFRPSGQIELTYSKNYEEPGVIGSNVLISDTTTHLFTAINSDSIVNPLRHIDVNQIVINIGTWDMNADSLKTVLISALPSYVTYAKIRDIRVTIRNDGDTRKVSINFNQPTSGELSLEPTLIRMKRYELGDFDTTSFDLTAGSYNRGWITIYYTD